MIGQLDSRLTELEGMLKKVGTMTELELVRFLQKNSDQFVGDGTDLTSTLEASGRLWVPGDLKASARPTPDAGFLLCDGGAVSRTTYAALFAAIGTAYGVGDGSTTFNVPDYLGRSFVGAGTGSGLTARSLGTKLGAETLAIADLPAHNHGGSTGTSIQSLNHSHLVNGNNNNTVRDGFGGSAASIAVTGSSYVRDNPLTSAVDLTSHTHAITSQGGGAADSRFQPSTVANIFIKY